jgi:pimeloyl-ACP methyl ester carboxylesterase
MEKQMATFVVAHGAWAGSWAWTRVSDRLVAKGHRVLVPALSGLGERSHLAGSAINLTTHIDDVVNEVLWKDLTDIVLVGHSYGGFVITGVAEKIAERIGSIVYVDAFIPDDGQAFADFSPEWNLPPEALIPAPPAVIGDYRDEADLVWVNEKATPQPAGTFTERVSVTGAYKAISRKTFVQATGWDSPFKDAVVAFRADKGWSVFEVACGHDIAIEEPDELTRILEKSV